VKKKNKSMAGFVVWRRGGVAAAAASCVRSGVSAYSQVPSVARHLHVTMAASAAAAGRSASSISQQEMAIDRQKTAAVLNPKEAPPEKVFLPPDKIGNQKKRGSSSSSKFLLLGKSEEELQDLAAAHGEISVKANPKGCTAFFSPSNLLSLLSKVLYFSILNLYILWVCFLM
jgi:hypothetical protein